MRKLIDTSNMPVADYAYICENIIIKYNVKLIYLSKIPLIEQGIFKTFLLLNEKGQLSWKINEQRLYPTVNISFISYKNKHYIAGKIEQHEPIKKRGFLSYAYIFDRHAETDRYFKYACCRLCIYL
jgi:hypothetical protein